MATNPFFSDQYYAATEDQILYEELVIESIQSKGIDVYYLPRTLTNYDALFGEDDLSAFKDQVEIEMFVENVMGWEGEKTFLSKFGMEIRDEATLTVSKKRFGEEVTDRFEDVKRPREGDLIIITSGVDKRVRPFEITFVDPDDPFMQLGKQYVYKIKVKNFEMNGETFETGVEDIDVYQAKNSIAMSINLGVGTGSYDIGEEVYQGTELDKHWTGIVVSHIEDTLIVANTESTPTIGLIIGAESGAEYEAGQTTSETKNTTADNDIFESSDVPNFDEKNPFSGW